MEDLSVKTKTLNPATLATAPGQGFTNAGRDATTSSADALVAAFSQFLRKAATKPDHVLSGSRGQVLPFDISFGGGRADTARAFDGFDRPASAAPRSDAAPAPAAPRDDRRPPAQNGGSSAATSAPDSPDGDSASASDSAANKAPDSPGVASGPAESKADRDPTAPAAKFQAADATENDEHTRGRKKKSAGSATAKDAADTPRDHAVDVLAGLMAAARPENTEAKPDDGTDAPAENSDDADESRRLAGLANALNQLVKHPRGHARSNANPGEDAQQSAASGEAEDAADAKDDATAKKFQTHGDTRARQAADLSERIGSGARMSVEVSVTDEAKTLISRPTAALFAGHDDKGTVAAPTRDAGAQADGTSNPLLAGNAIPDGADDIAARLSLLAGTGNVSAAPQAAAEADSATIQFNIQGVAQGSGAPARALDSPGQANAAQSAQKPAANFRAEVLEQVSVNIQKAIKDGTDRITIQLRPAELGRIEVKIEVAGDGRTLVHVSADRSDTLDLLQRDARDLARSLQDAGLRADAGNLQFSLREQAAENRERRPHGTGAGGSAGGNGAVADAEELPSWTPSSRPGRVDIRA